MRWLAIAVFLPSLTACSHVALPQAMSLHNALSTMSHQRLAQSTKASTRAERPTGIAPTTSLAHATALDALLHSLFQNNFNLLDTDHDGVLTNLDFEVPDASFHRALGGLDLHKDGRLTLDEYYSPTRATEMLSNVQARATVSALGVGGHVTIDKAQFMFDVYLQDRIASSADRTRAIQTAFTAADADHTGILAEPELEIALALLEAQADLRHLEHLLHVVDASATPDPTASAAISL